MYQRESQSLGTSGGKSVKFPLLWYVYFSAEVQCQQLECSTHFSIVKNFLLRINHPCSDSLCMCYHVYTVGDHWPDPKLGDWQNCSNVRWSNSQVLGQSHSRSWHCASHKYDRHYTAKQHSPVCSLAEEITSNDPCQLLCVGLGPCFITLHWSTCEITDVGECPTFACNHLK